jgi:large subunit ribosomal protein L32e
MEKKRKPNFLRVEGHKKIRLGSKIKKKRKWRAPKGRHNKLRLSVKGHRKTPRVGYMADKKYKGFVNEIKPVLVENLNQLKEQVGKEVGIIIAKVGKKKQQELIDFANKNKLKILNKYKKE